MNPLLKPLVAHRVVEEKAGTDGATTLVHWRPPARPHIHNSGGILLLICDMTLGYPIDSEMKVYVAESYAAMDELLA